MTIVLKYLIVLTSQEGHDRALDIRHENETGWRRWWKELRTIGSRRRRRRRVGSVDVVDVVAVDVDVAVAVDAVDSSLAHPWHGLEKERNGSKLLQRLIGLVFSRLSLSLSFSPTNAATKIFPPFFFSHTDRFPAFCLFRCRRSRSFSHSFHKCSKRKKKKQIQRCLICKHWQVDNKDL